MKLIICIVFFSIFYSCNSNDDNGIKSKSKSAQIIIQPYSDISDDRVTKVTNQLKLFYPDIIINHKINLPDAAYYKPRNRYRADTIIQILKRTAPANAVMVGLTSKDISTTKDDYQDWGVMGLGYHPGNACVASTFRLNKNKIDEQFYKVVIHELGHTQGLPHCPDLNCFMRDAEGGNPLDYENAFCNKCKEVLKNKGFNLN